VIRIRTMTAADIELGMRLKTHAGWNQVPADWWRMLVMQPGGCFVAELDGVPTGTAVACVFDKIAWIAMVLVDASVRGRGIGKALMQHALDFADSQRVLSVRLDATPLGQPLYEKLGFVPQYSLTRFAGHVSDAPVDQGAGEIALAQPWDAGRILALDLEVTQTDRSKFLLRLLQEQPERVYIRQRGGDLAGLLLARPGSNAWQLGPCIADADTGGELLRYAWTKMAGESVLLDAPVLNERVVQWAFGAGLQSQRQLLRMCRGAMVTEDLTRLWASSGPELG
jgi:GNAT superfamily N-acetyltransferase